MLIPNFQFNHYGKIKGGQRNLGIYKFLLQNNAIWSNLALKILETVVELGLSSPLWPWIRPYKRYATKLSVDVRQKKISWVTVTVKFRL